MDMSLGKLWELVMEREAWRAAILGVAKGQTWLNDWSELKLRPEECTGESEGEGDLIRGDSMAKDLEGK